MHHLRALHGHCTLLAHCGGLEVDQPPGTGSSVIDHILYTADVRTVVARPARQHHLQVDQRSQHHLLLPIRMDNAPVLIHCPTQCTAAPARRQKIRRCTMAARETV